MSRRTPAVPPPALWLVATILAVGAAQAAQPPLSLPLAAGARVGVLNLLDAEVTHFHGSRRLEDSYLKTYPVDWPVSAMLLGAVKPALMRLGLTAVPLAATEELSAARESCLNEAALARALPRECGPLLSQLAAAQRLDAIIVLAPRRNDAAATRQRELPQYLRGWCVVSGEGAAGSAPVLLSLTELLLIGVSGQGVQLLDRERDGDERSASGFTPPPDPRAIPAGELAQLQPLFASVLAQQADALLAHLELKR